MGRRRGKKCNGCSSINNRGSTWDGKTKRQGWEDEEVMDAGRAVGGGSNPVDPELQQRYQQQQQDAGYVVEAGRFPVVQQCQRDAGRVVGGGGFPLNQHWEQNTGRVVGLGHVPFDPLGQQGQQQQQYAAGHVLGGGRLPFSRVDPQLQQLYQQHQHLQQQQQQQRLYRVPSYVRIDALGRRTWAPTPLPVDHFRPVVGRGGSGIGPPYAPDGWVYIVLGDEQQTRDSKFFGQRVWRRRTITPTVGFFETFSVHPSGTMTHQINSLTQMRQKVNLWFPGSNWEVIRASFDWPIRAQMVRQKSSNLDSPEPGTRGCSKMGSSCSSLRSPALPRPMGHGTCPSSPTLNIGLNLGGVQAWKWASLLLLP